MDSRISSPNTTDTNIQGLADMQRRGNDVILTMMQKTPSNSQSCQSVIWTWAYRIFLCQVSRSLMITLSYLQSFNIRNKSAKRTKMHCGIETCMIPIWVNHQELIMMIYRCYSLNRKIQDCQKARDQEGIKDKVALKTTFLSVSDRCWHTTPASLLHFEYQATRLMNFCLSLPLSARSGTHLWKVQTLGSLSSSPSA